MAVMIAGFEVDFAWLLQQVICERAFKVKTIYAFLCIIFLLCRSVGVPILHIDHLKTPNLLVSASSVMMPMSWVHAEGLHLELPPLGENLADMVAHACMATQAAL